MNNLMAEMPRRQSHPQDWASRIQISGCLMKRAVAAQSSKWTKRFFMVKDGFLMYYEANERKEYDKREHFNIHPKGVIPLGECVFKRCRESQQPFCLAVESHEIDGRLMLAAESEFERDRWEGIMERSRRVTWKNTHFGDEMIRKLEDQGLEMAIEQQGFIDRLQSEITALSEERMRTEELERVNQELEKEKLKLEAFTKDIQDEYDKIKTELDDTVETMKQVETERVDLSQFLDQQREQLERLDSDKQLIVKELESAMAERASLSQEKQNLSQRTDDLQNQLQSIEEKTKTVQEEHASAEHQLQDNVEQLDQLESEKSAISEHACDLQSTIQDLMSQKEMTEKELKEEIRARISVEERLKEAERSLKCIDHAVQSQSDRMASDAKEEMAVNVRKLKDFFEDLAEEAKISSDKPIIIRNGMMARKTMARRAKTVRYENRKRSTKYTMSCNFDALRPKTQLRRAVTSVDRTTREQFEKFATLNGPLEEESF